MSYCTTSCSWLKFQILLSKFSAKLDPLKTSVKSLALSETWAQDEKLVLWQIVQVLKNGLEMYELEVMERGIGEKVGGT